MSNAGGSNIFYTHQPEIGTQPASCTFGTRTFPGAKRPRRGVDNPPHVVNMYIVYIYYMLYILYMHVYVILYCNKNEGIGKQWRLIQLLDKKFPRYFEKHLNFSIFFSWNPVWETPLKSGIGRCVPGRDGYSAVRSLQVCMRSSSWSSVNVSFTVLHTGDRQNTTTEVPLALPTFCLHCLLCVDRRQHCSHTASGVVCGYTVGRNCAWPPAPCH